MKKMENNSNKKQRNYKTLCFIFAFIFIVIGAVQLFLGHTLKQSIQVWVAIATWVYALILIIVGAISSRRQKVQSEDYPVFESHAEETYAPAAEPYFEPSPMPMPAPEAAAPVRMSLEEIKNRLTEYAGFARSASPAEADKGTLRDMISTLAVMEENAGRLKGEYAGIAETARADQDSAYDQAAEAYMEYDSRSSAVKKMLREGLSGSKVEQAKADAEQAKKAAERADERMSALRRREAKAEKLAENAEKCIAACKKMSAHFARFI